MNSNSKIHSLLSDTENILLSIDNSEAEEFAEWTNEKANLKFNTNLPKFHITNNYIYWCNLGNNIGSEQNKIRPVLVVKTSKNSPICTILPLTTERLKDTRWYHIDLEVLSSTVLIEQLRNISKLRFINPYRQKGKLIRINSNDWNKINTALTSYYSMTKLK